MGRLIALAVCLAIALGLAWRSEQTPAPAPITAPQADFSAARALPDVVAIARTPHPIGSEANARARDYLLRRMKTLGLETQVQATDAAARHEFGDEVYVIGGRVENLIGILPGADRTAPALAIMAHYDSVPGSPGAADDAAGVAAALEIVRALKTRGRPARDVILLITDGEEAGLLGAEAFFADHPLARRIGFVINMEARGGGGRAQMFQTGPRNGEVIDLFRRTAVSPASSSLTVFLYEQMPNDTDFTVSKRAGAPGLNYAFIGRQFDYHAPTSTPANLDKGSLQHMGVQTLSAARELAFAETLPGKAPDLVYANTFGDHILAYPQPAGWAVLALAVILLGLGVWQARRVGALPWLDVAKGLGAALYLIAISAALLRVGRRATGADFGFMEQRVLLAQVNRWEIAVLILGVGALVTAAAAAGRGRMRLAAAVLALAAGLACSIFAGWDPIGAGLGAAGAVLALASFGRPTGVAGAWTGLLISGLLAAVGLQVFAAPAGFLVAWPVTIGAAAAALSALGARRSGASLTLITALGAFTLSWLLGFGHGIFQGLDLPELLALVVWLSAMVIWPLVQPLENEKNARTLGLAILLLGFVVVAVVRHDPPWSARHPRASQVLYYVDLDANRALRVSRTPDITPWASQVLTADGGEVSREKLPLIYRRELRVAPAKPVNVAGPTLAFTAGPGGAKTLSLTLPPGARIAALDLKPSTALTGVSVNGRPVKALETAGQWTRVRWQNAPQGVTVAFRAGGPGGMEVRYATIIETWPAGAKPLPPRPADVMAFDTDSATVAAASRRFTW
ncbi:MAG: M20/M25/M40 family metallo-hydrolase [Phenylobacterium sp.]|uniref:M20/M25/M40 family metallo-hydrolase n=1 Tax=Phenylobacterium sp. TaxID=1871053 RepID=UPI0027353288|nr:M20/M25/M40 family metallo-hydrolase [Phenylobacterium sp.]MDP3746187.1 M20/M25/M40 family metallo-hydrolase [Phenylobacterium sp.]